MKNCGICHRECEDDAKTCPACGEASWVRFFMSLGESGLKIEAEPVAEEEPAAEEPAPEVAVEPAAEEPKRKRNR